MRTVAVDDGGPTRVVSPLKKVVVRASTPRPGAGEGGGARADAESPGARVPSRREAYEPQQRQAVDHGRDDRREGCQQAGDRDQHVVATLGPQRVEHAAGQVASGEAAEVRPVVDPGQQEAHHCIEITMPLACWLMKLLPPRRP